MVLRAERIWRRLRLLVPVAAALGLAAALGQQREGIELFPWEAAWLPFAAAVLAFSCGPVLAGTAYWLLLRDLAPAAPYAPSLRAWMRSFLARYVPSGALSVAVRVSARGRATRRQVLSATAHEQVAAALGGSAAAVAAFALGAAAPPIAAPAILVAAVVAAAIAVSPPFRQRFPQLLPVRARALGAASGIAATSWLAAGAAAVLLANAILVAPPQPFHLAGAYAFAWLVGFLFVLAPGGLGVREATLVALLAPQVGAGPAVLLAVVLRLANVVGDLVAAAAVELACAVAPGLLRTP